MRLLFVYVANESTLTKRTQYSNATVAKSRIDVYCNIFSSRLSTGKQNRRYFRMYKTVDKRNVLLKQKQKSILVIKIRLKICFLEEAGYGPACACE